VIDEAMPILSKAYKTRVPEPLLQRSRWHADPFAEGTIVHVPPGASSADILKLAQPFRRLRFAGDSTHVDLVGTSLGAFFSGVREAEKLAWLAGAGGGAGGGRRSGSAARVSSSRRRQG
jgi:monoamine oxidase